jgi:hypothetical protein
MRILSDTAGGRADNPAGDLPIPTDPMQIIAAWRDSLIKTLLGDPCTIPLRLIDACVGAVDTHNDPLG